MRRSGAGMYPCPYKDTKRGERNCRVNFETVRGWKKHMTNAHGQFTEEQLEAIVGAAPLDKEKGRAEFLSEPDPPATVDGEPVHIELDGTVSAETPETEPVKKIVPLKMK